MTADSPNSNTSPMNLRNGATSAGALIALVTVAALLTSTAPAVAARLATSNHEARHTLSEGATVRAVAAAVVAAARDLVGGSGRLVDALPEQWTLKSRACVQPALPPALSAFATPQRITLRESLLDLPPPARCWQG
jgi:hypothetical protein